MGFIYPEYMKIRNLQYSPFYLTRSKKYKKSVLDKLDIIKNDIFELCYSTYDLMYHYGFKYDFADFEMKNYKLIFTPSDSLTIEYYYRSDKFVIVTNKYIFSVDRYNTVSNAVKPIWDDCKDRIYNKCIGALFVIMSDSYEASRKGANDGKRSKIRKLIREANLRKEKDPRFQSLAIVEEGDEDS